MIRLLSLLLILCPSLALGQNATFTTSTTSGCSPLVITFDASLSSGAAPLTYQWDFGNGNVSTGSAQQTPGASYIQPGTYTVSLVVVDGNGNSSAPFTQTITAFAPPVADFAATPLIGCPDLPVSFQDLSTPSYAPIVNWTWDFGDGNSAQGAFPSHLYSSGTFPVSLLIEDGNGCQASVVKNSLVTVYPDIQLAAQALSPRRICGDQLTVSLEASVPGSGQMSFFWDFGDGNTGTGQMVSHQFQGHGLYDLTVVATDQATGCTDTLILPDYIQLLENVPDFDLTPVSGCAPLSVSFSNLSSVLLSDFQATWDFGDGTQVSGSATAPAILTPSHQYQFPGTYTPSLTIDAGNGCVETVTSIIPVIVGGPDSISFTVDTSSACAPPLAVTFTPNVPGASTWWWDFGDGDTSTLSQPTHLYQTFGNFDVTLVVEDANGCQQSVSYPDLIRIQAPEAAFAHNLMDQVVYPQAWDGRDPAGITGGCLPLEIDFTDQSTSPTPITDWQWTFGDGGTQNGIQNPTHTYLTEGEFSVSLTITTIDGCTSTVVCDSCIRAGNKPTALLDTTGYPLLQCCSAQSYFINQTDTSSHDYVWYYVTTGDWHGVHIDDTTNGDWDFGSTVPVFMDSGQYVSTMFYTYNYGCVDSFWLEDWTMLRPPYASAGIDQFRCASNWPPGGTVVFDTSNVLYLLDTAYIDSVLWEFGDPAGSTSNDFYPTFTYPDTGSYWLGITVWNFDNGCKCKTSGEQFLEIKVLPDTTFMVNPDQGCAPLSTQFTGPTAGVSSWEWSLSPGQGLTSQDPNPSFLLETPGFYDLELIVANEDGCADTVLREDLIRVDGIDARIQVSDSIGCVPFSVTFSDQSLTTVPVISRVWDLGDGRILSGNDSAITVTYDSITVAPIHQEKGFPVILTVTDSAGCTDQDTLWLIVGEPIPAYDLTRVQTCEGDSLYLRAQAGDSLGMMPLSWSWNNGTSQSSSSEWATFFPTDVPGILALTVTDSLGCTSTRIDTILPARIHPVSGIVADPVNATCPPLVVRFEDSSIAGLAPVVAWNWSFGDGTTSSLEDPTKIYHQIGTYDVSLIVTDSLGCQDTLLLPDLVNISGVQGGFDISDDEVCDDETLTFSAQSSNATSFTWDFGDGTIATGPTITHTYTQSGVQYPALILEDASGACSITVIDTVVIHPRPEDPLLEDRSICTGDTTFLDAGAHSGEILWNTGDTSRILSVSQGGIYYVTLTFPETGCQRVDTVEVFNDPLPRLEVDAPPAICEFDTLFIQAQTDPNTILKWSPASPYSDPYGTVYQSIPNADLSVRLRAINEYGCRSLWQDTIRVIPEPRLSLDHESVCLGDTIWLNASPQNITPLDPWYIWTLEDSSFISQTGVVGFTDSGEVSVWISVEGCEGGAETNLSFYPLPPGDRFSEQMNCVYMGEPVILDAGPANRWLWDHSFESSRTVAVIEEGWYSFSVFNEYGCEYRDSAWVYDACPPLLFVPTAFSPNGDGDNEDFTWGWDYVDEFELSIYNQWGRKLFSTADKNGRWDGSYSGMISPEGVYVWVIRYNGTHPAYRAMMSRSGTVTLFR